MFSLTVLYCIAVANVTIANIVIYQDNFCCDIVSYLVAINHVATDVHS